MRRRVVGIETEYGLTSATTTGVASRLDADAAARELFSSLLEDGRSTNLFLPNGGRLYLDVGAHPEYATAECDRLTDLLAQDRAGRQMLADLAGEANKRLEHENQPERLHILRNNLDSQGNSFGCHENYLLHRRRDFRSVADALVAFFVTRQPLIGSGYLRRGASGVHLAFSQRAEHMWDAVSSATTRSRPIINTRDEPLADSSSYRRMHVIVGDSNMCEATTALKVGATELLLQCVEDGLRIEDLALADPMRAIRELNLDLSGSVRVELADGRWMSAAEMQEEIRTRILSRLEEGDLDSTHRYVVDLWGRAITALSTGNWEPVETELDIAIKRKLLNSYCERSSKAVEDPRVARLDLAYHEIMTGSLASRLEEAGLMKRLTTVAQVRDALTEAPRTTRAHLRGRVIAAAKDAGVDLGVDWVHLRPDLDGVAPLSLQDPLSHTDSRVETLIDALSDHTTVNFA